jgi:hypothetical protein
MSVSRLNPFPLNQFQLVEKVPAENSLNKNLSVILNAGTNKTDFNIAKSSILENTEDLDQPQAWVQAQKKLQAQCTSRFEQLWKFSNTINDATQRNQFQKILLREKEGIDASVDDTPRQYYPYIGYDQYNALEQSWKVKEDRIASFSKELKEKLKDRINLEINQQSTNPSMRGAEISLSSKSIQTLQWLIGDKNTDNALARLSLFITQRSQYVYDQNIQPLNQFISTTKGDCTDHAALNYTLLKLLGYSPKIIFLSDSASNSVSHVAVIVQMGAQFRILDSASSTTGYNQSELMQTFAAQRGFDTSRILSDEEVKELVK